MAKKDKGDKKEKKEKPEKEKKEKKEKPKKEKKEKKGGGGGGGEGYLSKENINKELFGSGGKKEKCFRIVLLVLCLCVVLVALLIIIRARHFGYITKDYREMADNKHEEMFTYFVICGAIALVVALFGAIMALGGVGITLITLIILVAVAILAQLVFISIIGMEKNKMRAKVHESILLTTRTYYGFPESHPDIDKMQQKLSCCGYINHNDYRPSECRPDSCCSTVRYLECSTNYSDLYTDLGCRKAADRQIKLASIEYIIEFLLLVLLEIAVIVMTVILIKELKKGKGGDEGGDKGGDKGGDEGGDKGEDKGEDTGGD